MRRPFLPMLLLAALLFATVLSAARAVGRQETPIPPQAPQGMSMPAPEPAKAPPPLSPGPAPDLDLVFTNQVIGWIEPCG